ncbi:MAG: menaquinone biosynthesis protein [Calditrichaceae bacterium]|jgi:chorismate dehydratase
MNIEELFSDKAHTEKDVKKIDSNIAALNSFLADPLIHGLDDQFKIIRDTPVGCINRMIEGMVNLALIGTLDYAKGKGSWKLIPDICIAAKGSLKTINLFFNKDIRDLSTIAIDSNDPTAISLLKIIMQEKYEIAPEFQSLDGNLENQLKKADAVLLSGNEAFDVQQSNPMFIDLSDEWYDLTGLPFVYALWSAHEMVLDKSLIQKIKLTVDKNIENMDQTIVSAYPQDNKMNAAYSDFVSQKVIYQLGSEEKEAIDEFFRYAFFFGQIEHIPDLHFV